ncbi:MAG: elongation factor P [Candidatus Andersenbacteria bacterium CG10_big_fil_rev_8_21_14_0_10_54_11]|uniref:Elongation factor P n=1 Tax=Candidatus Andersenbacteria bacterium CG10_big_fil_rev_8_21_14_0_10_54_11 TaxID=1974485 RepID=A0A2M6X0G5_9BACT|nr:MAG: elongation factor P [Candidatus Andersenbacteria bacterium CG10_big_fil_rev_8_21_14_0_10_54_11]
MLGMTDIKKGKVIVLDGEPFAVTSAEFLRKQKRRPVVRSVLRHLVTGQTREHTFMQSDKVAEADVESVPFQFLFREGEQFTFMNQTTFEQVELSAATVGEAALYLLEGQEAQLVLFDGKPVAVELPIKIERKVVMAPPGVRGDTSSNVMKEVEIEGGAMVKAPLFIKKGDTIVIDTRTGAYAARA